MSEDTCEICEATGLMGECPCFYEDLGTFEIVVDLAIDGG